MGLFNQCPTCRTTFAGKSCPNCTEAASRKPTEVLPLQPGREFHGLEILEPLGRGGMGVVFKARQRALDRPVALKILSPERALDPQFEARFEREAKALASLSHPNIVTIHDFGKEGDLFFLTMEYVDGPSLRQHLGERRVPPEEAVRIALEICGALEFAHARGVVHRDIKPENVLIGSDGRLRIADFGLAKIAGSDAEHLTETLGGIGTAHYMAPEQMTRPKDVDHRADIFATGVVLYEMLTGELPVGRFEPPSRKVPCDPRLDSVILKALAPEPEKRHSTVTELKTDLLGATTRLESKPVSTPRRSFLWIPAILLAAGMGVGLFFLLRKKETPPIQGGSVPGPIAPSGDPMRWTQIRSFSAHGDGLRSVAIHGTTIATAGFNEVKVWDREGKALRTLSGHDGWVNCVRFSPDGMLLASSGMDHKILLWDTQNWTVRATLDRHGGSVTSMAFAPDGKALVSGSDDLKVKVWDVVAGAESRALPGHDQWVFAVAFGPDGKTIASGGMDQKIKLWSLATGEATRVLSEHTHMILSLAFSPDGKVLASGSADKSVRTWEMSEGKPLKTLSGHSGQVLAVAFRPDGSVLASGSADGTIRLWDFGAGREIRKLETDGKPVNSLSFLPTGELLVSGSGDGTVRVWGPGP